MIKKKAYDRYVPNKGKSRLFVIQAPVALGVNALALNVLSVQENKQKKKSMKKKKNKRKRIVC